MSSIVQEDGDCRSKVNVIVIPQTTSLKNLTESFFRSLIMLHLITVQRSLTQYR